MWWSGFGCIGGDKNASLPCKTLSNVLYIFWDFGHVAYVGKVLVLAKESIHALETSLLSRAENGQVQTVRSAKFRGKESTK